MYERKQHKPCFDEKCSQFLCQRKLAKMQWLQDPNKSNVDNMKIVRRETRRHLNFGFIGWDGSVSLHLLILQYGYLAL